MVTSFRSSNKTICFMAICCTEYFANLSLLNGLAHRKCSLRSYKLLSSACFVIWIIFLSPFSTHHTILSLNHRI